MMSLTALCVLSVSYFAVVKGQWNAPNTCPAESKEPWSYRGSNGPFFWGKKYRGCTGMQQSPIDILSPFTVRDENLGPLVLNNYDQPITEGTIKNNGHTIQVDVEDGLRRTISINGTEYNLAQFHFHWGSDSSKGSEHILDGMAYPMEMHLVHLSANNEIAVVGIFLVEGNNNEEMQKLVNQLPDVQYKNENATLQSGLNLNNLLPANPPRTYYRYQGSLTTPPCTEGVTWSVVEEPITIGSDQIQQFRQLYSVERGEDTENCRLVDNYRHVKPLLGRRVFVSRQ